MKLVCGKKSILLIVVTIFCMQFVSAFTVSGHIAGLPNGTKLLIRRFEMGWDTYRVDSCVVTDGKFSFTGNVPGGPHFHWIDILDGPYSNRLIALVIDNDDQINIEGDTSIDKMPIGGINGFITVTGSKVNNGFFRLFSALKFHNQCKIRIDKAINSVTDYDKNADLVDGYIQAKKLVTKAWESLLIDPYTYFDNFPCLLSQEHDYVRSEHLSILPKIYEGLTEYDKNTKFGKLLKEDAALAINQMFPDFKLQSTQGNSIQLKEIVAKSKAVIVLFWANNSYKIDDTQQQLLDLYKKYHSRGLDIIGISSDTSEKKWKISSADLPWYNVSDLKGANGIVEKVYHEYGFAAMPNTTVVLLDDNGKIIAWDLSRIELCYYLDRTVGNKAGIASVNY
ncbi:hypothetical protein A4H97_21070 [Niastella yeongjuensis]|uniref:Thioredoxin domain-containing protein n=1 Tax=Niastella yeongjuensis TaxID=354355 RepID=A0A1V9FCR7_9BACT|nr:redoxin domain-containing protein [Niastella yeongjuensis]OQP56072.1 hypothetical protein A4H97_21070 [Niastella yeongjuensis]SEP23936.1 Peroxiredoxin [Niastella yeongjuensis]